MKASLQNYFDQWESPWMQLYYRMVWAQVGQLEGQKILDFGSGFGWNANHFAAHNEVVAVEPSLEMVKNRQRENTYEQIVGGLSALSAFTDGSFDVILCHNVFEYAPKERLAMLREFTRLISKEGFISIVKHNHAGALMQKIVFENALDEAYALLRGASKVNQMFGKIHYYDIATMLEADGAVSTFKTYGLRTFWALQPNEFTAELEIVGVNPFVTVPSAILQEIFKAAGKEKSPIPICGAVNHKPYQQNLMFFKGQWRLYVNMKMLKNSPQRIGETLKMTIAYDAEPRLIEQPQPLKEALAANPDAQEVFEALTPSKQLEINRYIAKLKSQEAIERNVARAIGFLLGKNRFVGRDKP